MQLTTMARKQNHRPQPTQQLEQPPAESPASEVSADLEAICQSLEGLRYGQVTAIVREGVVVQIDRTQRTRLV